LTRKITEGTLCLSRESHFLQNKKKSISVIHLAIVNVTYWTICTFMLHTGPSILVGRALPKFAPNVWWKKSSSDVS